jgi:hypothetical protein
MPFAPISGLKTAGGNGRGAFRKDRLAPTDFTFHISPRTSARPRPKPARHDPRLPLLPMSRKDMRTSRLGFGHVPFLRPTQRSAAASAGRYRPTPFPSRREEAVQGRRQYTRLERESSIATTSRSLPRFSGGGSWAEPLWKAAHRRIPTEGVSFEAPPSWFRPRPLVPGVFWFRARVILRTDGPTRPTRRLPVPGTIPAFPHPEPPL